MAVATLLIEWWFLLARSQDLFSTIFSNCLSRPLSVFSSFQRLTVNMLITYIKILMTGYEPRTSGSLSNRSATWATTTAHLLSTSISSYHEWWKIELLSKDSNRRSQHRKCRWIHLIMAAHIFLDIMTRQPHVHFKARILNKLLTGKYHGPTDVSCLDVPLLCRIRNQNSVQTICTNGQ